MSTDTKRPRGRPRDPGKTPAILEAARQVVAARGVAGASMGAIAGLSGAGKPTLYLRFADKDELVTAAMYDLDLEGDVGAHAREVIDAVDALVQHERGEFLLAYIAAGDPWRSDLAERLTAAGHGAALPPFDAGHAEWAHERRHGWATDGAEAGDA